MNKYRDATYKLPFDFLRYSSFPFLFFFLLNPNPSMIRTQDMMRTCLLKSSASLRHELLICMYLTYHVVSSSSSRTKKLVPVEPTTKIRIILKTCPKFYSPFPVHIYLIHIYSILRP